MICGAQFESLFPGLGSFGRDKQIAWMMWHAAADRKLPEIGKVLEGVPDDLARAVQKMIVKDPARRYQSAAEVLRDLAPRSAAGVGGRTEVDPAAEAAAIAAAKRQAAAALRGRPALALFRMLCLAILLPPKKPKPAARPRPAMQGVVLEVKADWSRRNSRSPSGRPTARRFPGRFRSARRPIRSMSTMCPPCSAICSRTTRLSSSKPSSTRRRRRVTEVSMRRGPRSTRARSQSLQADEGSFVLAIDEGDNQGKRFRILVPPDLQILLNGAGIEQASRSS